MPCISDTGEVEVLIYHDQMSRLARRALLGGGEMVSRTCFRWDISGRCQSPEVISLTGRPEAADGRRYFEWRPGVSNTLHGDIFVPCRRCEACLRARRRLWTARALTETRSAVRTWFGTLTLAPDNHMMMRARTIKRLSLAGVDWASLDETFGFVE